MRGPSRILTLMLLMIATAVVAQPLPSDPQQTCVVNPANSIAFQPTNNCAFYLWAHQMFLWLTSPAPSIYGPGAHVFDSSVFYDVSIPDAQGNRHLIPHTRGFIHNL